MIFPATPANPPAQISVAHVLERLQGDDRIAEGPTVDDVIKFVDSVKGVVIALIVLFMAFYVTITPGIAPEYAGQWVGAGMTVVGVYIGSRTIKNGMVLAR